MASNKKLTIDKLGGMIQRGFDENTKQHQQILATLDKHAVLLIEHTEILKSHTKKLDQIETKLEGMVYREEFEKLENRIKIIEEALAIKR